jgi:hypothetical protein
MKVLALDLERTLILNSINRKPRPGLYEFLEFACDNFERVALFTAVPAETTYDIIERLVLQGYIPEVFWDKAEYIEWTGKYKDLSFVPNAAVDEILLVDDSESYISPNQKKQWIPIKPYEPPFINPWTPIEQQDTALIEKEDADDDELNRIRETIEAKLNKSPSLAARKQTSKPIILFLDIDGVIATLESYQENEDDLDLNCIDILNQLLDLYDFEIVVTSTWRNEFSLDELRHLLKGLHAEIIGITPKLRQRGQEIRTWIERNHLSEDYIIIDDEIDEIITYFSEDKIIHIKNGFDQGGYSKIHLQQSIEIVENLLNRT